MACTTEAHPSCSCKSWGLSSLSASCLGINCLTDNSQYKSDGWHWMQLKRKQQNSASLLIQLICQELLGAPTGLPRWRRAHLIGKHNSGWLDNTPLGMCFMRLKENIYLPCSTRAQNLSHLGRHGINTLPIRGFCLLWFFCRWVPAVGFLTGNNVMTRQGLGYLTHTFFSVGRAG